MIPRLVPIIVVALLLSGGAFFKAAAQSLPPTVEIDVEGNAIMLAPLDADAFQRRLNQPPELEDPPLAAAPSYTVTTAYWDEAVRGEDDEDEPAVDLAADYFPQGGLVRARQDGEDVWLVLDLRQRAILDRYIRYAVERPAPDARPPEPRPGALLIVFLKAFGVGEPVDIEVGNRHLGPDEARSFWESLAPSIDGVEFVDPPQPPKDESSSGYWVTFTLPEGRALQYFLDPSAGTLTDSLGTGVYDISDAAGGGIPDSADISPIVQEDPVGSQLWWLLGVGGGLALLVIAFWLQRRFVETE